MAHVWFAPVGWLSIGIRDSGARPARLHRLLHAPSPDDDTCTLAIRVTG